MSQLPETYVAGFHDEAAVRKMKYRPFGKTGLNVSELSFGCGGFSYLYGTYNLEDCKAALHEAIKKGVNYIDTAPYYGHGTSEEILGKCLEGIPRKAYYLATKVARYDKDPKLQFDYTAKRTKQSIETSLKRIGVDYIDIIQVHDVEFAPNTEIIINETLPTLEQAVKEGKARFIGVTGYPVSKLDEVIKLSKTKIDMVLCYTRLSLVDQTINEYLPYFQSKGLGIVNAAAHCMGLLSNQGPQPWHPASQHIQDVCTEARKYCIAQNVELGKLATYYAITQPGVHTNLIGMNNVELVGKNLDVIFNGINAKEEETYKEVQKILKQLKQTHWEGFEVERYWKTING